MSRNAPDHGKHFVPGGESAPNRAPQSLDHFKRGYRERADQREREMECLNGDFDHRRSSSSIGGSGSISDHQSDSRNSSGRYSNYSDRSSYSGPGGNGGYEGRMSNRDSQMSNYSQSSSGGGGPRGSWNGRGDRRSSDRGDGRSQIVMGLDVQALVDRISRRDVNVFQELDATREENLAVFESGKAITAIISNLARRRNLRLACTVWDWIDSIGIRKNTFHYNSMISVCEKVRDYKKALRLLDEMREKGVDKNEVTFSSAISACEKCGQWRMALDLLEQMKREGAGQTAIAYNAAISACEKGLVPHKALEIFEQMKREGVQPTVVTYSALISAAEKGQQWKLALQVLEEMKAAGHGANVIAYSAAISALSKGQMWHKALELFREIEATGGTPSIVTYNATMTALEKGLQWERALDLFDEMKMKNMPVTVVSYGSAISACEKGLQYRQCLEFLDEMTEMGIKKNVIIFGAAMSCMEKSCRADIAFQLMDRMKLEGVAPNVHIYNSAISACARCNLWERGYELFKEMESVGVARDVVTYNAVLDAVCSQVELGRQLFKEGVEKGFYSRVSRLGAQWLELDLHFLSLGGGEIALGWWFEECLVPYLVNTSKLEAVQSISIVTGYGKTRSRGARMNDDGMRLRVRAMLQYMDIAEMPQPNKGRIHIDKKELILAVEKKGGRIIFDLEGYTKFKQEETTANKFPDVPQKIRPRFRPAKRGEGPPGTFIREGGDDQPPSSYGKEISRRDSSSQPTDTYQSERRDSRRSSQMSLSDERGPRDGSWQREHRGSYSERSSHGDTWRSEDRRPGYSDPGRRGSENRERDSQSRGYGDHQDQRHGAHNGPVENRRGYDDHDRRSRGIESGDRQPSRDWPNRSEFERERRGSRYDEFDRHGERRNSSRMESDHRDFPRDRDTYRVDDRQAGGQTEHGRGSVRDHEMRDRRGSVRDFPMRDDRGYNNDRDFTSNRQMERAPKRQRHSVQFGESTSHHMKRPKRVSDSVLYVGGRGGINSDSLRQFATIDEDPDPFKTDDDDPLKQAKKRSPDDFQRPTSNRGYNIAPSYAKRHSA